MWKNSLKLSVLLSCSLIRRPIISCLSDSTYIYGYTPTSGHITVSTTEELSLKHKYNVWIFLCHITRDTRSG